MITISRAKLQTFLLCQRRFQLRYVTEQAWPEPPLTVEEENRLNQGKQFHQLVERYLLGFAPQSIGDPLVQAWWQTWQSWAEKLPNGRYLPEFTLTIPLQGALLRGRFDLVLLTEQNTIHIFDWKTGHPPTRETLRHDWQTRFYLGMMAESGVAVTSHPFTPAQIQLTYWYTTAPPQTFIYDEAWHDHNWAELQGLLQAIRTRLDAGGVWPLTEQTAVCQTCPYQILCGRHQVGTQTAQLNEDNDLWKHNAPHIEPALP